jgi:TonB family protein
MSETVWNNLLTYTLQIGLLVGLAAWLPAALRLRSPKARLTFFQLLLASCLLLPFIRPWRSETLALEAPTAFTHAEVVSSQPMTVRKSADPRALIFGILALGFAARLSMLGVGMLRLRRYRRRSTPLDVSNGWDAEADIRLSEDVAGPVTFGLIEPVILLPAGFPDMTAEMREAILCHETLHVRRYDWLFTVAEELIRAALWFHPAIWWLLGEIQLNREQAVDHEVVGVTNARVSYVDALMAAAGAAFDADLAPAPLFLRKRHLKQRVVSILKEKQMSKKRTVSTLVASLVMVAGACWYLTGAFPLSADPQLASDAAGVSVDLMGAQLMHRAPVAYPRQAAAHNISGTVVAQVKLDADGNVSDASVLSGPDELRVSVLRSLLSWHFTKEEGNSTRQVAVKFTASAAPVESGARASGTTTNTVNGQTVTVTASPLPRTTEPSNRKMSSPSSTPRVIKDIVVDGLNVSADQVTSKLPVHVGDTFEASTFAAVAEAIRNIDEHLRVIAQPTPDSGVILRIVAPRESETSAALTELAATQQAQIAAARAQAVGQQTPPPHVQGPITVGRRVQAAKLISQTQPVYPDTARQARISGTVELAVIITPDGHVQQISVVSGHPLLRQSALDAVKQWVYQPTLLNEQPVAVSTTVDVIFSIEN